MSASLNIQFTAALSMCVSMYLSSTYRVSSDTNTYIGRHISFIRVLHLGVVIRLSSTTWASVSSITHDTALRIYEREDYKHNKPLHWIEFSSDS